MSNGAPHGELIDNVRMQFGVCQVSTKNRLECIVTAIKSYQHFNCLTFPFLAGTKLHVHGVNYIIINS